MYQRGKFSYSQQSEMVATNRQRYSRYREQERREWNKCLASLMTQLMRWIGTQMPRSKSEAVITNFAISGCLGRGGGGGVAQNPSYSCIASWTERAHTRVQAILPLIRVRWTCASWLKLSGYVGWGISKSLAWIYHYTSFFTSTQ